MEIINNKQRGDENIEKTNNICPCHFYIYKLGWLWQRCDSEDYDGKVNIKRKIKVDTKDGEVNAKIDEKVDVKLEDGEGV